MNKWGSDLIRSYDIRVQSVLEWNDLVQTWMTLSRQSVVPLSRSTIPIHLILEQGDPIIRTIKRFPRNPIIRMVKRFFCNPTHPPFSLAVVDSWSTNNCGFNSEGTFAPREYPTTGSKCKRRPKNTIDSFSMKSTHSIRMLFRPKPPQLLWIWNKGF